MESTKKTIDAQVRWLIRRDLPEVLESDRASYASPWSEEDYLVQLRKRNSIGMVAEFEQKIVGQMVYELERERLHVVRFCVAPHVRLRGIGREMAGRLVNKLSQQRRQEIYCELRESNIGGHLFLKASGFTAVDTIRGFYDDTGEDAYVFAFWLKKEPPQRRFANSVR